MSPLRSSFLCGLAGLAACSPYSPDLGNAPYLCADSEPRCPADYACVMDEGTGREVCLAAGGVIPDAGPDAHTGFTCAMDGPLEPNDMLSEAYQTDVGLGAPMRIYGPISICPEGDKDLFQINITAPNQGVQIITRWDSGMPVYNSLLNAAGTSIANGLAMGTNALRACVANLPVGQYFAAASAATTTRNNYRIEMKIVAACN